MEDVNKILEEIVNPSDRDKLKDLTKYTALPIEHKKIKTKIVNKKQLKKQKKFLSRNDMKQIGLYSLPTDELKYRDYVPLNQLWESYLVSTC
jgi:hypothetical protein